MKIVSKVFDRLNVVNTIEESDGTNPVEFYPNSKAVIPGWSREVPVRLVRVQFKPKEETLELLWNVDLAGIAKCDDPPIRLGDCPECGTTLEWDDVIRFCPGCDWNEHDPD